MYHDGNNNKKENIHIKLRICNMNKPFFLNIFKLRKYFGFPELKIQIYGTSGQT